MTRDLVLIFVVDYIYELEMRYFVHGCTNMTHFPPHCGIILLHTYNI